MLGVLLGLVALLVAVGSWYLVTRKPIQEFVLPAISQEQLPHYAFSIYGVSQPVGVAVSPSGDRIYVAETGGQRLVHVFDGRGHELATFSPPRSTPGGRVPVYLALDPASGDVYVSDRLAAAIHVFDRDGRYRRTFEPRGLDGTWKPLGLAFDGEGNLYVSEVGGPNHRILEFHTDGTLVRSIGAPGEFSYPNGLAVSPRGDLFVADGNNGRLLVIDGTNRQVGIIPRGAANGELGLPRGTALDDAGRLYVADATSQAVQLYRVDEQTGRPSYLGTIGLPGRGDGQFAFPNGVAADTRARLYVADWGNNRVQVWSY